MPSSQEIARVMAEMDRFNQSAKVTVTEERYEKRVASVGGSYGGLTALLQQGAPGNWASDHKSEAEKFAGWHYVAISSIGKAVRSASVEAYQEQLREYAKAYNEQDDDSEPLPKWHPLMKLLKRPNPSQSGASFREEVAIQLCLTGSALIWNVPNQMGRTVERYVIPTAIAEPRQPERGRPKGGWYINPEVARWQIESGWFLYTGLATAIGKVIDARDVQVIRFIHPIFKDEGQSPVSAGALWTDTSEKVDVSRHSHLRNGSDPSVIIGIDGVEDEGTLQRMSAKFNEKYAGPSKHGKAMFVNGQNVKVEPVTRTPAEMAYEGAFVQFRDAIMALHGVTPIAAGIEAPSGDDGLYAPLKQFISGTVQPILDLMAEEDTEQLAGQFGEGISVLYTAKAIDDAKLTEQQINTDILAGAIEVDEIRKLRGRKPWGGEKGKAVAGQGAKEEPKPGLPGLAQGVPGLETKPNGLEPQTGSQALDPSEPPQGTPDPMKLAEEAVAKALGGFADRLSALLKSGDNCGTGAGGFQEGNTCGQRRAKKGGQVGMNGEFYAGGQFLPSTDMPKRVKAEMDRIASGKVKIDEGVFEKLQPGEFAPYQMIGTFLVAAGRDKEGRLQVKQNNDTALAYLGVDTQEKASKLQNIVNRFNAGERKLSIYDYPSFTNGADIIRALSANMPVPESMIGKLQPNIAKFVTRNGEATAKAKTGDNCGTGAGGFKPGNDCAGGESSNAEEEYKDRLFRVGKKIRNREQVSEAELSSLKPDDRAAMERLRSEYKPRASKPKEELKVVKKYKNGVEVVDGKFSATDEPDEYLYHVTTKERASKIGKDGFVADKARSMGSGFYEEYSKGKVFFADRNGVSYWQSKVSDHLESQADGEAPELVVLRVPKASVSGLEKDDLGTKDSRAGAYFVRGGVKLKSFFKSSDCGANAQGGGGFQPGNTCGKRDGKDSESAEGGGKGAGVNPKILAWAREKFGDDTTAENFAKWFGDSKVVDEAGNPLTVYHGTGKTGFTEFNSGSTLGLFGDGQYFTDSAEVASEYSDKENATNAQGGPGVYAVHLRIEKPFDMDKEYSREQAIKLAQDLVKNTPIINQETDKPYKKSALLDALKDRIENGVFDSYGVKKKGKDKWSDGAQTLTGEDIWSAVAHVGSRFSDGAIGAREKLFGNSYAQKAAVKAGHDGIKHTGGGRFYRHDVGEHKVYITFSATQIKSATGNSGTFDPKDPNITKSAASDSYNPPESARNNARKVLRWKEQHGDAVRGMTATGWARANQLASGEKLSRETVGRMAAFARHRKNSKVDPKFRDEPWRDAGYVAWLGWGGDSGINWAAGVVSGEGKSGSDCGANAQGGGGFQPGNTCGSRDGGDSEGSVGSKPGKGGKVYEWALKKFKDEETARNFTKWFGDSKVVDQDGNPLRVYHGTAADFSEFNGGDKNVKGAVLGTGHYFTDNPNRAAAYAGDGPGANTKPVYLSISNPMDLDSELTQEQADRLGAELARVAPNRGMIGSPRATSEPMDKEPAKEFYNQKLDEWKQRGEGVSRTKPKVISSGDKFSVEYSDTSKVSLSTKASEAFRDIAFVVGPDSSAILSRAGFDGVKRADEYVAFSPYQIKSATGNSGKFDPESNDITKSSDCGANGPGGGGFQPGNTCGKEDGEGESVSDAAAKKKQKANEKEIGKWVQLGTELQRATGWGLSELMDEAEKQGDRKAQIAWMEKELDSRRSGEFAEARKQVQPHLDKVREKVTAAWDKEMSKMPELARQLADSKAKQEELQRKHVDLFLAHRKMRDTMGQSDEELAEFSRLGKEMDAANKEVEKQVTVVRKIWEKKNAIPEKAREKVAEVLRKESLAVMKDISPEAASQFEQTSKDMADFIKYDYALRDAGSSTELDKKARAKALTTLTKIANPEIHQDALKAGIVYQDGARATAYSGEYSKKFLDLVNSGVSYQEAAKLSIAPSYSVFAPGSEQRVYLHEYGHQIEFGNREANAFTLGFLESRTKGDKIESFAEKFGSFYRDDEKGVDDNFIHAFDAVFYENRGRNEAKAFYTGKSYEGGLTEVLPMGLELFHENPKAFAEADPEWFDLVTGTLTGRLLVKTQDQIKARQ